MKTTARSLKYAFSLMSVFLLSGVMVPQSHAACGSGNRMSPADAECLIAGYHSRSGWKAKKSTYWAENECPEYAKVVAKIDRSGVSDATWHLTNGDRRSGSYMAAINGVYCCTDEGGICNKSDIVTSATCVSRFNDSVNRLNSTNCTNVSATISDLKCVFTAQCRDAFGNYHSTGETVAWLNVDTLKNCGGSLRTISCSPGPGLGY